MPGCWLARRLGRAAALRSGPVGALAGGLAVGGARSSLGLAALAPLAPALLAVLLGVGLGRGLLRLALVDRGSLGQIGAIILVEAELGHRGGEVFRQGCGDIQRRAIRVIDDQAAGVEVHLAADRA